MNDDLGDAIETFAAAGGAAAIERERARVGDWLAAGGVSYAGARVWMEANIAASGGESVNVISLALVETRNAALEEAAQLVDHHPFADDASAGCEEAQGCCEVMAAQIRARKSEG